LQAGYFKGIAAGSFRTDSHGHTVFFPYGVFARGRVLVDSAHEQRVRAFVTRYNAVGIVGSIGIVLLRRWILLVAFVPIVAAWYYFGARSLIGNCPYSDERLTIKESYANSASAHNAPTLWLLLISSALFVVASAYVTMRHDTTSAQKAIGVFGILFFGAGVALLGRMLRVRRTKISP
jgi:hypothetical protein